MINAPPPPKKTVAVTVDKFTGSLDPSLMATREGDPTKMAFEPVPTHVQYDTRPLKTRQEIIAQAKALKAQDDAKAKGVQDAERALPVTTNDPNFLAAVHALEGNVVVPSGLADGSVFVLETENTRPDAVLKGAPMPLQNPLVREAPSYGPGATAEVSQDGSTLRVRRPQPQEQDPLQRVHEEPWPTDPRPPPAPDPFVKQHAIPPMPGPAPQSQQGSPVIPGGGLIGRAQARLKTADKPVESWGFYKFLATASTAAGTAPVPLVLPSNGVFYNPQVSVGIFSLEDLWLVAEAHETQSITPLIAAMANVVSGCDVRELTVDDFYYLMHIVRLRSYPRTPWTFSWRSKYGNMSSFTVTEATLPCISLDCTAQDFEEEWGKYGIDPPRVKHWEAVNGEPLTEADQDLWSRAQYLYGESIEERVAHALTRGLPVLELVRDYKQSKFDNYGVKLTYTVRDPNFQPTVWLSTLQNQYDDAKAYRKALANEAGEDAETVMMLDAGLAQLAMQVDELRAKLATGLRIEADEEEVRADIEALTFFPQL